MASLSEEEAAKAQQAVSSEADEFQDALEDDEVEGDGNFTVTDEELSIIRAELASDFPDDYKYLSDAYILSVASKPYSKDPSIRRPLEVSCVLFCCVAWPMMMMMMCHFLIGKRCVILFYYFTLCVL